MKKIINKINNYIINNYILKHIVFEKKFKRKTVTYDNFESILNNRTCFSFIISIMLHGISILIYGLLISYFVLLFLLGICFLYKMYNNYIINIIKETDKYKEYKKEVDEAKANAYEEFNRRYNNFRQQYNEQFNKNQYNDWNNYNKNYNINTELINAFKLFELSENSSIQEIKSKYKKLALQYHPDKYANEPSKQEIATRNFQKLNTAYEVIKNYKNFK